MSGPWLPSAGRAEKASIVPSGEYEAVSPTTTTLLMMARAVAVGSGADASTDGAAPVGVASGGEPAGPIGPVLPAASVVEDGGAAALSPGVPEARAGDADDA